MEEMNNVMGINNDQAEANHDFRKGFGAGVGVAMGGLGLFFAIRKGMKIYKDIKEAKKLMNEIDDIIDDDPAVEELVNK